LVEGGAAYLEVQIPFSDPSADGPVIQHACSTALAGGTSTAAGFELIAELRRDYPHIPVFVMAYASLVVAPGTAAFAKAAARAGVSGLIVPDLPFDSDEGLAAACAALGADAPSLVGVAAPSMRPERLARMAALGRPYLYAALRAGITGTHTAIDEGTRTFLAACAGGGARVLGGFGVRSAAQARALAPLVHAVVVGSLFVETIDAAVAASPGAAEKRDRAIYRALKDRAAELTAG
jgi:tryptophan synthase alpha chain